jgi:hypothetical protein
MRTWFAVPLSAACLAVFLALPVGALAHEQRDVGKYHFVVGFLNEPVYQNQLNGIDLTVTTADKQPVEGLDKTLKAEVIVGGNARQMPIPLQARFGMPGKYAGYFMPTMTGAYTFHFSGTINGEPVDQRFESGPGRFGDVQAISDLQFPQKLTDPAQLQSQVSDAQAAATMARTLAIIGIIVGLAGGVIGVAGLARRGGAGAVASRTPGSS